VTFRAGPLLVGLFLAATCLGADDGASSIAAGGLVVMTRETRITMAKEVLQISQAKVVVDYDFRNDSDDDVTTLVAFPIPPYDLAEEERMPSEQGFDDFRLWVNEAPAPFRVDARAFVKGIDRTRQLQVFHVDVSSFGHATSNDTIPDIARLTPAQHRQLEALGLIEKGYDGPPWQVHKKYYWKQAFPAHKTIHIRHQYTPALGSENSIRYGMAENPDPDSARELKSFCIDDKLHGILKRIAETGDKDAPYSYVDFILTTANTWKTPIEDFTLIAERPHESGDLAEYVSFCWDGPVTKVDSDHFSAHAVDLIPKKELRIGFFDVRKTEP